MKILITGSNGYIGKHVCSYFKDKGDFVIGVGRKKYSESNVDDYVQCDYEKDDTKIVLRAVFEKGIDTVLHLAADNRHEPYGVNVVHANCVGTQSILELCEEYNVSVFIQLSSIPVIGKPVDIPITKEHKLHPPTVYHATKCLQELLAEYANYTFGLRTVSIRIPSPIGRGMNPKTIFPTFVKKAMHNEDIVLIGKGSRKQTYVCVADICKMLDMTIHSRAQGVYLLSSNNLLSNYELAKKCIEVTESKSKIIFDDREDPMDDYCWKISMEELTRDTGFVSQGSIEDAILDYKEYLKTKEN